MGVEQKEYKNEEQQLHEANVSIWKNLAENLKNLSPEKQKEFLGPVKEMLEKQLEKELVEKVSKTFEKINKLLKTSEEQQQLQELKDKLISTEWEIINQENFQKFVDSYVKSWPSWKIFDIDQAVIKDGILYCHDVDRKWTVIKWRALNESWVVKVSNIAVNRPDMWWNKNFEFQNKALNPAPLREKENTEEIPTNECPPLINLNIADDYYNLELGYEYGTPDPVKIADDMNKKLETKIDQFNNGSILKEYEIKNPKDVSHKIQFKEKFTGNDRSKDKESFKKFSDEYNQKVDWIKKVWKNRIEADSLKYVPPQINLQK